MKKILFIFLLVLIVSYVSAFDITKNGEPLADVVLSPNAAEEEKYAAEEFVRYIKLISGAELAIKGEAGKGNSIYIGQSSAKAVTDFDFAKLKTDGIFINCKDNILILAGDKGSGTIYSVYTFLDEYLGVKYLTPKEDYIPKKKTVSVKNINKVYVPPFWSREAFYKAFWDNPSFCLKTKHNGHYSYVPENLGGHNTIYNFVHNICWIFSPDVYGKEHPEWYALWGSQRTLSQTYFQLCLTNKEMIEELTKKTLECYEKDPSANIVDLSIPDCGCY
ncbi:MAG: DUF4838 domain-containing protein, partial [Armatimonadetes bacterium]|nr:DUF4838 domain-containing protein [Candidatus Hippobium faecium]